MIRTYVCQTDWNHCSIAAVHDVNVGPFRADIRCEENQHLEFAMMKPFMAATLLALSTTVAFADNSLPAKATKDLPGTTGGATADPTAKPDSGSLSEKAMQDQPGVNKDKTGTTADPTAKPADGSLAGKVMKDNPAIGK
jgi:hypothetical protein